MTIFYPNGTFENFIHRLCPKPPSLDYPYADGKWKNFRVHIIAPPLTPNSVHITLRKHPVDHWTFSKLQEKQWAPSNVVDLILKILNYKMNILIAGPTSSGKTSVLNACLQACSSNERIILIEDTDELKIPNSFSVKLLTRSLSPLPYIDQSILVQQSLRMRPDRIAMGEVRGKRSQRPYYGSCYRPSGKHRHLTRRSS